MVNVPGRRALPSRGPAAATDPRPLPGRAHGGHGPDDRSEEPSGPAGPS